MSPFNRYVELFERDPDTALETWFCELKEAGYEAGQKADGTIIVHFPSYSKPKVTVEQVEVKYNA